jgi:cobyrinic acid a,c-diamide synthase/ABC-type Fe3+-hydroxamate transport system substrate-binding protein
MAGLTAPPAGACPCIVIGGTASGVGKTSIAVGLMAALRCAARANPRAPARAAPPRPPPRPPTRLRRSPPAAARPPRSENGLRVQAFKVGPDFLDPMHHEAATGRPSINLDGWMLGRAHALEAFRRHTADADVAVVEGAMGLFDGRDGATEDGSTAQVAKWLGAPVALVLDASAAARSAAAAVKGFASFDPALRLEAVIFNKVGGGAHLRWLADAVAAAGLGAAVLGGVPREPAVEVGERHLGLRMPRDAGVPPGLTAALAALVRAHVDLGALLALAATARPPPWAGGRGESGVAGGAAPPAPASPPPALPPPKAGAGPAAGEEEEAEEEEFYPAKEVQSAANSPRPDGEPLSARGGEALSARAAAAAAGAAAPPPQPPPPQQHGDGGGGGKRARRKRASSRSLGGASANGSPAAAAPAPAPAEEQPGATTPDAPDALAAEPSASAAPAAAATASADADADADAEEVAPLPLAALVPASPRPAVRLAVARDAAFCFYYHDNLALLAAAGAELVPFSPLAAPLPRGVAGVYLGGGYPERHAAALAENRPLRAGLAAFASAGGVVYAECGGLLLLAASLQPRGEPAQPMAGVFPFRAVLPPGKYTMGYVEVTATAANPLFPEGVVARGHVHHASELVQEQHVGGCAGAFGGEGGGADGDAAGTSGAEGAEDGAAGPAWRAGYVARPQVPGAPAAPEGFSVRNVLASYVHLHFGGAPELAAALVASCAAADVAALDAAVAGSAGAAARLEGASFAASPPPPRMRAHASSPEFARHAGAAAAAAARVGASLDWGPGGAGGARPPLPRGPPGPGSSPSRAAGFHRAFSSGSLSATSWPHGPGGEGASPPGGSPRRDAGGGGGFFLPAAPRHARAGSRAASDYGLDGGYGFGAADPASPPMPRPGSWAHLAAAAALAPPGRLAPGPLDLASLRGAEGAAALAGGSAAALNAALDEVEFAASGSATPHNWRDATPPSDKIVTLGPGATETAWALGLGARVAAVSDACDFPAEASGRAKAARRAGGGACASAPGSPARPGAPAGASSSSTPSRAGAAAAAAEAASDAAAAAAARLAATWACRVDEQVLARERPGLIVYEDDEGAGGGAPGASPAGRAVLAAVVSCGLQRSCRVVAMRRASLADVLASVLTVGEAAGVGGQAAAAVGRLRARLRAAAAAAARAAAAPGGRRPRALILASLQPLVTVGLWAPDAAQLAGCLDGLQAAGDPPAPLSWAQVVAYAPEVLVVCGDLAAGGRARVWADLCAAAALPGFWLLPAVRAGAVFVVERALLARAGPRLVDGVEALARMAHADGVPCCAPPGAALKLSLRPGQRCRPRLLPSYFVAYS